MKMMLVLLALALATPAAAQTIQPLFGQPESNPDRWKRQNQESSERNRRDWDRMERDREKALRDTQPKSLFDNPNRYRQRY